MREPNRKSFKEVVRNYSSRHHIFIFMTSDVVQFGRFGVWVAV